METEVGNLDCIVFKPLTIQKNGYLSLKKDRIYLLDVYSVPLFAHFLEFTKYFPEDYCEHGDKTWKFRDHSLQTSDNT